MKIIDAHTHTLAALGGVRQFCKSQGLDPSVEGLRRQMEEAGVEFVVSITDDLKQPTPIGLREIQEQRRALDFVVPVLGVNPHRMGPAGLERLDGALRRREARGIKIWAGYYHVPPNSRTYDKIYGLAERHGVPVVIHTGDTFWSGRARRNDEGIRLPPRDRYGRVDAAHPLAMEEVANRFDAADFIVAHVGNPCIRDAALVAYHNENVFLDLSAFLIGGGIQESPAREDAARDIGWAMRFVGEARKFLYGSDWPLVEMRDYLKFVKAAVGEGARSAVFYENAKRLFRI